MNATGLIVSLTGGLLAILIATLGYFIKKWIESVDATLKEQSQSLKNNTSEIISLKSKQDLAAESFAKAISAQQSTPQLHGKIDKISEEVSSLKEVVQRKVLPQLEHQSEQFGKVTVIESQLREQDKKMVTFYQILQRLAQRQ